MSTNPSTPPASHNWYAIHTLSGQESRVAETLRQRAAALHLDHRIGRILLPPEEIIEVHGPSVTRTRTVSTGFIFVEMDLNDDLINLVKSTPKVTGFVGGSRPTPVSQTEIESLLKPRPVRDRGVKIRFEVGDEVRILDGPFAHFYGFVDNVDQSSGKLQVKVFIFGRSTPVELESRQVEKK